LRSGLRHFSAGADVAQFDARIEQGRQLAIGGVHFLKLLELLPIPIVVSVHGVALGGGAPRGLSPLGGATNGTAVPTPGTTSSGGGEQW